MPNTGIKQVLTLAEYIEPYPPGTATGNTKPNVIGDIDYIAPYEDLTACPVGLDITCPSMLATGGVGQLEYELSITPGVAINPNISKIRIVVRDSGNTVTQAEQLLTLPLSPSTTFTTGIITGVPAGTHSINTEYLNSADELQETCLGVTFNVITT